MMCFDALGIIFRQHMQHFNLVLQFRQKGECDPEQGGDSEGKSFWDIVADPRTMDRALDTENVDYNITMAQTTRYTILLWLLMPD